MDKMSKINDWSIIIYEDDSFLDVSVGDDYEVFFEIGKVGADRFGSICLNRGQVDKIIDQLNLWKAEELGTRK